MDLEKWLKKLKSSRDFTTAVLCLPKCNTTTKRYYVIIALRAGAVRGDMHCPSSPYPSCYFIP